jgi:predicted dehydrogenase
MLARPGKTARQADGRQRPAKRDVPMRTMNRRRFLQQAASASALVSFPSVVRSKSPNSNLQIASIGVGGMGGNTMMSVAKHPKARIVALCDVDAKMIELARGGKAARGRANLEAGDLAQFQQAAVFADYRELFSKAGDTIDAVTIGTPDHMHVPIALTALRAKKHVYLQKPLAHDLAEARVLAAAAKEAGVITQMGTQGHSSIEGRLTFELVSGGAIGKVREVICWENKEANWWPKVTERKPQSDPVPEGLDWNLWLGVARETPYLEGAYHRSMWRAWFDFGVGMMGDMGCHYFDIVLGSLGITAPRRVRCLDAGSKGDLYAKKRRLEFEFAGNGVTTGQTWKLTWMDGGYDYDPEVVRKPAALTRETRSGIFFAGESGGIFKPHSQRPWLVPEEKFASFAYPKIGPADHYTGWVDAAMAGKKADTDFVSYGCPVTEAVLLGVLAERNAGDWIEWDAAEGKVTNHPDLNTQLARSYRQGWV